MGLGALVGLSPELVDRGYRMSTQPHWTDQDVAPAHLRGLDEEVQFRRRTKRLADIELPAGFQSLTENPKQFWMNGQLTWGFKLGWAPTDNNGIRWREDCFSYVSRYDWRIADDVQMEWALADFSRELRDAGCDLNRKGLRLVA